MMSSWVCRILVWALKDLATACIAAFMLFAVTSYVAQGLLAAAPTYTLELYAQFTHYLTSAS